MSYRAIYNPVALLEYADAAAYYSEHSEIAALEFYNAVKNKMTKICENPYAYKNSFKQFREVSVETFPYSIVYTIDEESRTIVIDSIFHHKRNPKKKYRK